MNINSTLATLLQEPSIRSSNSSKAATKPTDAKSASSNASASATHATAASSAGPAATVTISNDARAQLRAAGVSNNEISRINLKDKNAVMRAIQRARMSHAQHSVSQKKGSGATNGTGANSASRDVTPNKSADTAASPAKATERTDASEPAKAIDNSSTRSAA